jgi:hypothetical protein
MPSDCRNAIHPGNETMKQIRWAGSFEADCDSAGENPMEAGFPPHLRFSAARYGRFKRIDHPPERWPSGLRRTLGKRVYFNEYRGFESHSLRQLTKQTIETTYKTNKTDNLTEI